MKETEAAPETEGNLHETIERVWGILVRRRWWILTAACSIPLAVVAVVMKLPDQYVSHATVLAVQQQVSQRYVQPDSTTTTADAVQAMKVEILSAGRLLAIINDFGLYPTERQRLAPELLVDRMRQDVEVEPLAPVPGRIDFSGLTIAFTAATPQLAQEVTSRLTSLFIEQNLKTQGEHAANTTKFLSDQVAAAKQRLSEQEQRLQAFKSSNTGQLPEQQQANVMALMDVRGRIEAATTLLLQVQQKQASIESSLLDRLARLQSERAELLTRFTPRHPDVVKKDHAIETVQSTLDRVKTGAPAPAIQDTNVADDSGLAGIVRQAEANVLEIDRLSKLQQKLNAESEQYQTRLNLAPVREQQLAQILRDYDVASKEYGDLEKDKTQSQLTASLEENQEGQQFRLVDPPTLPAKPSSPKRIKISLGGVAGGILMGLLLAFLIDSRDTSFHSEKSLTQSFAATLVLGMPLVLTSGEKRTRNWKIAFEWLAGCVMTLMMLAAQFYVYRKG